MIRNRDRPRGIMQTRPDSTTAFSAHWIRRTRQQLITGLSWGGGDERIAEDIPANKGGNPMPD